MSWFGRLLEKRSSLSRPERWLIDWVNGGQQSATGLTVTDETALGVTAFYRGVRLIAGTIATLPLWTYKRLPTGGKARDPDHPLFSILHDQPNRWQTSVEFWEMLVGHCILRGNGYARVIGSPGSAIDGLVPLHPDRVRPRMPAPDTLVYEYRPTNGAMEVLFPGEIFHLRGFSLDGIEGVSPIRLHREAIGMALAAEEFGARLFGNGASPRGVIHFPDGKKFKDEEEKKKFRDNWRAAHGGVSNSNSVAVLEHGMQWTQIGINPDDAQFLQTRKFQVTEMARILGLPPHALADLERSTNNNIEHQGLELVTYTLREWLVRIEKAIRRDLFTEEWQRTHFVEFLVDGLLRGDAKTRAEALQIQRRNGVINGDDWAEIENRNPLPDGLGQIYIVEGNMTKLDKVGVQPKESAPAPEPDPEDRAQLVRETLRTSYRHLLTDAAGRVLSREAHIARGARKPAAIPTSLDGHAGYCVRAILPVLESAAQMVAAAGVPRADAVAIRGLAESLADAYVTDALAAWRGALGTPAAIEARAAGLDAAAAGTLAEHWLTRLEATLISPGQLTRAA